MLEALLGKYVRTVRFSDPADLAEVVNGCGGRYCRIVVYPEDGDTIIIIYTVPGEKARIIGYRDGEGLVKPPIQRIKGPGYAEVFIESEEQAAMDMEYLASAAASQGRSLDEVLVALDADELRNLLTPVEDEAIADCVLGLDDIILKFGKELSVDEKLSRMLSIPSTTGRILLMSELGVYERIGCGEVKDTVIDHFRRYDAVALRFVSGPYSAWVIKCGDKVGIALFQKGRVVISGKDVVRRLREVEAFVARAIKEYGATVMAYLIPKKLMVECDLLMRRVEIA